jgi:predicted DNA-binding transcriptional regulator AlpA
MMPQSQNQDRAFAEEASAELSAVSDDLRQPTLLPSDQAPPAQTDNGDTLLSTEQVAELLGVDASTLRRWRSAEPPEGPTFVRISERVTKYWRSDVLGWIDRLRVITTLRMPKTAGN